MTYDLVINGGTIVTSTTTFRADIGVRGETIAAIGDDLRGTETIDATGKLVIPGAIDSHVHMRTPGAPAEYQDTFYTGSVAAAFGGVTTFLDQAQVLPGTPLGDGLAERMATAEGESVVDYGIHVNVREGSKARLADIEDLLDAGFKRFKFFTYYDGYKVPEEYIFRGMKAIGRANGLSIVHAENDATIRVLTEELRARGSLDTATEAQAHTARMEGAAIRLAVDLAALADTDLLIFHVSCEQGVRELARAKRRGQPAYGEACLHYLLLDESDLTHTPGSTSLAISPPLRNSYHRDALWRGLSTGALDVVSTDHGPRRTFIDEAGTRVTPAGTSGIEVRLALIYQEGVRTGRLTPSQWVNTCCTRPAKVNKLARKGELLPGFDADIVIFDPGEEKYLTPSNLHSDIDHCTYEGMTTHGWPSTTICRGAIIVADSTLRAPKGFGRLIDGAVPANP